MKINITLPNPKCCDGCPIMYDRQTRNGDYETCALGYDIGKMDHWKLIRPQKCIDDNGE